MIKFSKNLSNNLIMCTTVLLYRKEHPWSVIIGSNRDEELSRKSLFPGRHWPATYPNIIGGYDIKAQGSWIAINDFGILAIMHNRKLEENNLSNKKSRGSIILDLLNFDNIESSIDYLKNLNQSIYNGFNVIICDKNMCYWGKHNSVNKKIKIQEINEGLSIVSNKDLNDISDKKINYYLSKFSQAPIPDPNQNSWLAWELLLSTTKIDNQISLDESISFTDIQNNFGTRSSSLLALSTTFSKNLLKPPLTFRSTETSPEKSTFIDVDLYN